MNISQKHKDKLIGGLIGIVLLALGLWVKNYFEKSKEPLQNHKEVAQSPTVINQVSDSAKQNTSINKLKQDNSGNGKITNEFVAGDKKTYNYNQSEKAKKETQLVNNGFINNGGSSNTYNQTINPKPTPRIVSNSDINSIINKVPKSYTVNISFSASDKECNKFGRELAERLALKGFSVTLSTYGVLASGSYNDRFELTINESSQQAEILVYILHE